MEINNNFFSKISPCVCGPSRESGVYAVCCGGFLGNQMKMITIPERILYIGSSENIMNRILKPSHPYRRMLNKLDDWIIYTKSFPCSNYRELESELIKIYKPILNKIGK